MDRRTREYLSGRFGDYYRDADPTLPPAPDAREWGHIPWTGGESTTMVRHQSIYDLGDVDDFLAREAPRHVYFSAARYDDPGADTMDEKGWRGADLVFDLDADHLPSVDPAETTYAEMLAACKDALQRLLDLLETDFGFEDVTVVFSGGRGYHVHVRDDGLADLDSAARREIVDYVRAVDLDIEGLVRTRAVGGATRRELRTAGGWGRRTHRRLREFVAELQALDEDAAQERLMAFDGIGEGRATTLLGALDGETVADGNVEAGGPGARTLVEALARETVADETAPIDEPVTTDTHRLIRLPGSLHGGSGLVVARLDRDELDAFDPLVDAVPERFTRRSVRVDVTDPGVVELDGDSFTLDAGEQSVPECVGVFLMTRDRARKVKE
ncbi:DNA primase small subunit PriS [Haloplanus rubicundus]|uniref:DNA primase small subunit PriS n=1 Tax=Haloplanus rubicundus TaxID=1547898 RepID=A0A345EG49_9EURY|nr:DNA primase small subunit PriS [Haloplanus rubicundus]AXG11171.1 DNA primase catalytic subunit PriS [Haloplanus rubicundus]